MSKIEFRIEIEPEDISPEGQFDSGDPEQDAALIAEIRRRLEFDLWAWCYVKVIASIDGIDLEGVSTLGGCSYFGGESEFRQPGGYFDDLCSEAKADLLTKIKISLGSES